MRDLPRLSWLSGKTFSQSAGSRKNRPGLPVEHRAAMNEQLCVELDKQELAGNAEIRPDCIDTCAVCGVEIPPGPDTCSNECETKMCEGLKNATV